ncbi:MAG: aldo/keto reductase [Candidatus Nitrohelix vancouverensis]|uniref:Aldo/keto reductase n=1 Tax=Candidatus Nitrohelix vancouverensis TaxID=2705534 RepID=A0A7T0G317_9BACT|nr:MAG: aldo/keto reductase [Candidatus Nitrohelix vancouverensis]
MKYRKFSSCGWEVSEIGLGTWQLGADWGKVDDATAERILETAVDCGINFFDTADVYGLGLSETRIQKFLAKRSEQIIVATKLGRHPEPGWPDNFSLASFRKHTEDSLRRLGVEALDLTQVHCLPTETLQSGELFDWLRQLKQEGKIKQFGLSVESMEEALLCLKQTGLASLQIIFNVLRQKPIPALFEKAKEKGVAIIVRLPLASGLLSGKITADSSWPQEDHRNFNQNGDHFNVGETFSGLPLAQGIALMNEILPKVPEGMTCAQMALRWILDHDAVTTVIPGATRPEQVKANASASKLPLLSAELHEDLRNFYEEKVVQHIRGKY